MYAHDSNAILVHPLKTRQGHEIKAAWQTLHKRLTASGVTPTTYIMDNEASGALKAAILKNKLTYQLTPPHMHRINAAERAIRTFKNHFIAGLATIDPQFPIGEWDRLLPQHKKPTRPVDAPHHWRKPVFDQLTQYNTPLDTSPRLTPAASVLL